MSAVELLQPFDGAGKIEKIETAERILHERIEIERVGMR